MTNKAFIIIFSFFQSVQKILIPICHIFHAVAFSSS